ncbi:MAG: hypothetical protein KKI08_20725 [Armatimonadetes bacterium]|nr:hypothetical protein [Armatimonadota bacterium]
MAIQPEDNLPDVTHVEAVYCFRLKPGMTLPHTWKADLKSNAPNPAHFRYACSRVVDHVVSNMTGWPKHDDETLNVFLILWDLTGQQPLPTVPSWLEAWNPPTNVVEEYE